MNNIYTDTFSEAFAESHPYEYKQKYTSKKGKQSYSSNETSFTKKAKSCHNSNYKQARDAKRMNWGYVIRDALRLSLPFKRH